MTNSFRAPSLERSYLTYSHRQRQKSLLIVNIVDLLLKIGLGLVWVTTRQTTVNLNQYYLIKLHFSIIILKYYKGAHTALCHYLDGELHAS